MVAKEKIIMKTIPNWLMAIWGLVGCIFFGWMSYLTYKAPIPEDKNWIYYLVLLSFPFFFLWSFYEIIKFKIIVLTDTRLIIKRPMLLYKKSIALQEILRIEEENYEVAPKVKGTTYNVHKGKKCLLYLNSGKTIKFTTYEILDYQELLKKLYIAVHRNKKK